MHAGMLAIMLRRNRAARLNGQPFSLFPPRSHGSMDAMTDRDTTPRAIHNAAVAMAGGPDVWAGMDRPIQGQYIALAEMAAPALIGGGPVPWDSVALNLRVALGDCRGMLTQRKAEGTGLDLITKKLVESLARCGYTVIAGPPAQPHGGNFRGHRSADE